MISSTADQAQTLAELLRWRSEHQDDRPAFTFLDRNLEVTAADTYGSLAQAARSIAAYLLEAGVKREPVLLAYPSGPDFVRALWGIVYAGAIAVPVYPPVNARALSLLKHVTEDSGARYILAEPSLQETLGRDTGSLAGLTWLHTDNATPASGGEFVSCTAEDPALIQYTSGSVENPKGVLLTNRNILANSLLIQRSFIHTSKSRGFIWLPPYHDMGLIGGIIQPVFAGFPTALTSPRTFLRDPLNWLRGVSVTRATTSGGPNFAYERCLQISDSELAESGIKLNSWQVAFNGAERVSTATMSAFSARFIKYGFKERRFMPSYGLAESTLYVASAHKFRKPTHIALDTELLRNDEVKVVDASASSDHGARLLASHGFAPLHVKIVKPDTDRLCWPNEVGEIWVTGDSVAAGYWRKESTATFEAQLSNDEFNYLRTGDLGFIHRGELYITGRLKELIVIAGRNYYPEDVESTVQNAHPALEKGAGAAFAIPLATSGGEDGLIVVQELTRGGKSQSDLDEVTAHVRMELFNKHGLSATEVCLVRHGTVPLTRSGKIQRMACRDGYLQGKLTLEHSWRISREGTSNPSKTTEEAELRVPPSSPDLEHLDRPEAETALLEWMKQRIAFELKISAADLDPDLHFGLYGLDSLVATTMICLLSEILSLELDDSLLWDYPNFNLLNSYLIERYFSAVVASR